MPKQGAARYQTIRLRLQHKGEAMKYKALGREANKIESILWSSDLSDRVYATQKYLLITSGALLLLTLGVCSLEGIALGPANVVVRDSSFIFAAAAIAVLYLVIVLCVRGWWDLRLIGATHAPFLDQIRSIKNELTVKCVLGLITQCDRLPRGTQSTQTESRQATLALMRLRYSRQ